MASIKDAFIDTFDDRFSLLYIVILSVPVFLCANLYLQGNMDLFWIIAAILAIIAYGALTNGIHAHNERKDWFVTLNPLRIGWAVIKSLVVVVPQAAIWGAIAWALTTYVTIPLDVPNIQIIYSVIIWLIAADIIFSSYLLFAATFKIREGYNIKTIFTCGSEVMLSMIFFIPTMLIVNAVFLVPLWFLFDFCEVPQTHWGFVGCCSFIAVVNIYIIASCLSQIASTSLKLGEDYYSGTFNID